MSEEPRVPVVRIRGALSTREGTTIETLGPLIDRAYALAGEGGAIIVDIESPGGSPVQSELVAMRLRRGADERGARVVAVVGEICAAGAYWVACAADEIVAHAMSVVGLNGVIGVAGILEGGFDVTEGLRRSHRDQRSGTHAATLSQSVLAGALPADEYYAYAAASTGAPFGRRQIDTVYATRLLDDLHDQFRLWVQTRRGERLQMDATPVFSGSLVLGEQALAVGLVDRIGDLETLVRELGGANARAEVLSAAGGHAAEFQRFAIEAARLIEERARSRGVGG